MIMAIKKKISASAIKQFTIEDKRLNDTEIPGFHARIFNTGRIVYYLYYRLDGKQVNCKIGSASDLTPAQARDLAREKMGEVAKGNDVHAVKKQTREDTLRRKHLNLSIFLQERYLPYLHTRNPKTANRIVNHLRSRFDFLLERDLDQVTPWDVEKWRSKQRKLGKAPATINYTVNTLKGALSRAVEWGLIDRHDLSKVKAIKCDNTRVRYLTEQEEKRLRHALKERDQKMRLARKSANVHRQQRNQELYPCLDKVAFADYLEPLVLLAINTGLRRGELLQLAWADISFSGRYLTVRASNAKSKQGRIVPLNDQAFSALQAWREQNPDSLYIYEGPADQPLTDVKNPWALLLETASIIDFRFHDLRHHFASKLVMAGVDLNTVRELLGHADLNMTLRYAHLAPEHKAAAVSLIG